MEIKTEINIKNNSRLLALINERMLVYCKSLSYCLFMQTQPSNFSGKKNE